MEDKMHKYYRDFCQTILGVDQFNTSVLSGEEDIAKIEEYAETHREIKLIDVEDDRYEGSILILIPHPDHGVTIVFVPQSTTIGNTFFMYPNTIGIMAKALLKMKKEFNLKDEL